MEPLSMMALMGAIGLGKSALIDAPKEARQRKLAAATTLYSPWTGMQADKVQEADPFGSTLQGVAAGAMYGQQAKTNDLAKEELDMKKSYFNSLKGTEMPNLALGSPKTTGLSEGLDFGKDSDLLKKNRAMMFNHYAGIQ